LVHDGRVESTDSNRSTRPDGPDMTRTLADLVMSYLDGRDDYIALGPFFDVIRQGPTGRVEGEHISTPSPP
jgi:hypothetical protein